MSHHSSRKSRAHKAASTQSSQRAAKPTTPDPQIHTSADRRHSRREAAIRRERQKKQLRLIIGGIAAAVIVATMLIFLNRPDETSAEVDYNGVAIAQPPIALASGTPSTDPVVGPTGAYTGTIIGDPDAPVTFIIYSDYRCHFCQQFHAETYPKIIDDFVRAGDVKIELRDYPILGGSDLASADNRSARAAEGAMCAAEQDDYIDYHTRLWANFSANGSTFTDDRLAGYASDAGLDTDAFDACLASDRYLPALQLSLDGGRDLGITGTPTFVIDNGNGQPNVVQQTSAGYDLLRKQIQAAIDTAP